jgi:hypothetical protein
MGRAKIDTGRRARDFRSRRANLKKVTEYSNNVHFFNKITNNFYIMSFVIVLYYFITLLIRTARPEIVRMAPRIDYSTPYGTINPRSTKKKLNPRSTDYVLKFYRTATDLSGR